MDNRLDAVYRYTNNKYNNEIQLTKFNNKFNELWIKGDCKAIKNISTKRFIQINL